MAASLKCPFLVDFDTLTFSLFFFFPLSVLLCWPFLLGCGKDAVGLRLIEAVVTGASSSEVKSGTSQTLDTEIRGSMPGRSRESCAWNADPTQIVQNLQLTLRLAPLQYLAVPTLYGPRSCAQLPS